MEQNTTGMELSSSDRLKQQYELIEIENARVHQTKDGYHCLNCNNRKGKTIVDEELPSGFLKTSWEVCKCVEIRKAIAGNKENNLGNLMNYKLEDFLTAEGYQQYIKTKAIQYINEPLTEAWFTIVGQSGIGKTMICSIICNERIKQHRVVKYLLWTEFVEKLKRMSFDENRNEYFSSYANVEILYIDDLLKGKWSEADVTYAFRLINARYNQNLVTIISTELDIERLREVDEALAGRINEKSKGYLLRSKHEMDRNYRFKGGGVI